MGTFKNTFTLISMILLLISASFVFIACPSANDNNTVKEDDKKEEKEKPSPVIPLPGGGPDTGIQGARNSSFIYFYYPTDGKIYYVSDNDIHTMSLDGTGSTPIKDNTFTGDAKARYIYVHDDKVYYDDGTSIYRMNPDGTSHKTFIADGHGMMKVYGDTFYYFVANKESAFYKDLMSVPLDTGTPAATVVEKVHCYIDELREGNFYVDADSTVFYYSSTDLFKKVSGSEPVILSEGNNDNYVFAKDFIYFRDHYDAAKHKSFYGISKGLYNAKKEMPATIVRVTDGQLGGGNILNVSSSWMVYYNRVDERKPLVKTVDLRYVSLDGETEEVLVPHVAGTKRLAGEVKIIGDYAYYMLKESSSEYSLYRVKKDGTGKKKLATIKI